MRHTPTSVSFHILAVIWFGIMAGFFGTYSFNVNVATQQMDGATYAAVQSSLNNMWRSAASATAFVLSVLALAMRGGVLPGISAPSERAGTALPLPHA